MASFNIHLAVGKRYLEKTNIIENEKSFYKGIVEPDLVKDKKLSHYTGVRDERNIMQYLSEKVNLNKFLENENINSDYQKGVFLHLITDYLFFNNFFDDSYLKNVSYSEFCKDLYYSYDVVNSYLENKYNIDSTEFLNKINNNIEKDKKEKDAFDEKRINILPFSNLDAFVEYVSNINLEEYRTKIIESKDNILPF